MSAETKLGRAIERQKRRDAGRKSAADLAADRKLAAAQMRVERLLASALRCDRINARIYRRCDLHGAALHLRWVRLVLDPMPTTIRFIQLSADNR